MADAESEQSMSRTPEELRNELDYWKAALEDASELNDATARTAAELLPVPLNLLELTMGAELATILPELAQANRAALEQLKSASERVGSLIDLIGGRIVALQREKDGEL